MAEWTLTLGARTASLATWGISKLTRRLSSQATDVVGFTLGGIQFDADLPIAFDDEIRIERDGIRWFVGRVTRISRAADGQSEAVRVEVSGPWWYLTQLVYQQVWKKYEGGEVHKSHCMLNQWADGSNMGIRDQINEILQWVSTRAIATYGAAPFQWVVGEIPDVAVPVDEVRDITCSEAFQKQLRWAPDVVTWFDYSQTPPMLHCRRRGDLETRDVEIGSGITAIDLVPREDLLVPAVVLKYERLDQLNGTTFLSTAVDAYPPTASGEEFGALTATIDLEGFSRTSASCSIVSTALPGDTTEASFGSWWAWLKTKEPWLSSVHLIGVDSVIRGNPDTEGRPQLPYELIRGQIPPWMGAAIEKETVELVARIAVDSADGYSEILTRKFGCNIQTTNAKTGTYKQDTSVVIGEAAPIGLAQFIYEGLSVLDWDGAMSIVRQDVGSQSEPTIGHRINVRGGRPEWEAAGAMVQEVSHDIESGLTTLRVGPPQHLGPRDLIELLRVNRFRYVYTAKTARGGTEPDTGSIALGRVTPKENSTSGTVDRRRLKIAVAGGYIDLDPTKCIGAPIEVREVAICLDGAERRMLILCSEPY